jgi:hypothetical protein
MDITNPNPLPNPNSRLPITMEGHVHLIGGYSILPVPEQTMTMGTGTITNADIPRTLNTSLFELWSACLLVAYVIGLNLAYRRLCGP